MKKIVLLLFLLFPFVSCDFVTISTKDEVVEQQQGSYKVVSVKDGDTIGVLIDGKEERVRFNHIDCPEKAQPFGKKAKQFVSDKCYGDNVTLEGKGKRDQYGRIIAEVILSDGTNLNKELVKNGLAWHYKTYSKDKEYAELENAARGKKIGIWSQSNPTPPWEWRKKRK
ncbi:MAG: thermonuclease family protein [Crocinitomicaceae bacterium]|nr:thermonuclease family protein [Crocinitomicaceae bacterium]